MTMRRRLFNLAAAVSLIVSLAMATLWLRSYVAGDKWIYSRLWEDEQWAQSSQHSVEIGWGAIGYTLTVQAQQKEFGWQAEIAAQNIPTFTYKPSAAERPNFKFGAERSMCGTRRLFVL